MLALNASCTTLDDGCHRRLLGGVVASIITVCSLRDYIWALMASASATCCSNVCPRAWQRECCCCSVQGYALVCAGAQEAR